MKLTICSNSTPRWDGERGLRPRSPGGLVPLLASVFDRYGGDWVCTAAADGPDAPVALPGEVTLHPVRVPAAVAEHHYLTIGIEFMLRLFHQLFDTATEPVFDRRFAAAWADYEAVNAAFATTLSTIKGTSDEVLIINDYHLFLLPEFVAARTPRPQTLVYVHGLPWCEPAYLAILPAPIRDRILLSLVRCDVVAFHDRRWAQAFVDCCARFVPGIVATPDEIAHGAHRTRIVVAEFPLDTATLDRVAAEPATAKWRSTLAGLADGRRVLARADRLDLWKNQLRGFLAYRELLDAQPELADDWWFGAIATLPRRTTTRSRAYHKECERVVTEINTIVGRPAAAIIYPDADTSRHCVAAALSMTAVTLVNPTIDGMNLVAKEALWLAPEAPLLLSVNAGAYPRLGPYVTAVEPFDVSGTARLLATAMTTPAPSRPVDQLRRVLAGQGPSGWLDQLT